jgi:uncharacterized protein (TIGR02246 family)
MTNRIPVTIALLLLATTSFADDTVVKPVQQVLDAQVVAWNRGDLEGFMAGYWKSEELTFQSGKDVTKGWQATMDRYRKRYKAEGKEMGTLVFRNVVVKPLAANVCYVTGEWDLTLPKEKEKENPKGLFTLIVKKTADGWKIVHDHTSN